MSGPDSCTDEASEGQGLFRVTSSFVPLGHLAVGSPRPPQGTHSLEEAA